MQKIIQKIVDSEKLPMLKIDYDVDGFSYHACIGWADFGDWSNAAYKVIEKNKIEKWDGKKHQYDSVIKNSENNKVTKFFVFDDGFIFIVCYAPTLEKLFEWLDDLRF